MWALLSGVFASGLGYVVWYQVLKLAFYAASFYVSIGGACDCDYCGWFTTG